MEHDFARENTPGELSVRIEEMVAEGWTLYGSPFAVIRQTKALMSYQDDSQSEEWYQAMVKDVIPEIVVLKAQCDEALLWYGRAVYEERREPMPEPTCDEEYRELARKNLASKRAE
jgi:hypothetical protein